MIEKLIGLAVVAGLGSVAYAVVPTAWDTMPVEDFAAQNGVSEIVLDCAENVLAGEDAEGLIVFIENEAITAGTPDETATAEALRECVYLDPLGWHGTPNEEYIYLLETETWDDH